MAHDNDVEAQVAKLQEQLGLLQQVRDSGVDVTAQLAGVEAQLRQLQARQIAIIDSPRAMQAVGDNNVQVFIEHYVEADREALRVQFHDYLSAVWAPLINLPLLAVRGAGRGDVPLTAVYTALDVGATVGGGGEQARAGGEVLGRPPEWAVHGLRGDPTYLERLMGRVRRQAETGRRDREPLLGAGEPGYSRRVSALEAAAAAERLVLLGAAGSGKSTFAKYLALGMAGQLLNYPQANLFTLNGIDPQGEVPKPDWLPWPHGVLLPIFVELRQFIRGTQDGSLGEAELGDLRRAVVRHFNREDLRTLCFDLGMDYDDLPAEGKEGKVRELLLRLARESRVGEIIDLCARERPNVSWARLVPETPEPFRRLPARGDGSRLLAYLRQPLSEAFVTDFQRYLQEGQALLILDGLDEVPFAEDCREWLRQEIAGFSRRFPRCRMLVTSRPYAYNTEDGRWRLDDAGFVDVELAPFDDGQMEIYIRHWYSHLVDRHQLGAEQAQRQAQNLWQEIKRESYLRPLAERPLMLTMMADLHASEGGKLPQGGRAALYERSTELLLDRWNETRELGELSLNQHLGMPTSDIRLALEDLAFTVHGERGPSAEASAADINDWELWKALDSRRPKDRRIDDRSVMDFLHQRSGILVGEDPTHYRFAHRTYQEYLAACHLTRLTQVPVLLRDLVVADPALWREVALFAAGRAAPAPLIVWALLEKLVPKPPPDDVEKDDVRFWSALYAGLAIQENRLWERLEEEHEGKLDNIRLWLRRSLELGALPPPDRAAAGRVLGELEQHGLLGDDRIGVGLLPDGLPHIDWVTIPAGPFRMGSDPTVDSDAYGDERPPWQPDLDAFRISRYPITNRQYQAFVDDGGYTEKWHEECWTDAGWDWKGDRERPDNKDYSNSEIPEGFLLPNHPRVAVTWYEANAFCNWLRERSGESVHLPREVEWEKAARGTDGRVWPWGNTFDTTRCNMGDTGIGRTCAVGMFPLHDGPWKDEPTGDVLDMSGNVWEWCATKWLEDYKDYERREDNDSEGKAARVLRGGAFLSDHRNVRCAYRSGLSPGDRVNGVGFRVAALS